MSPHTVTGLFTGCTFDSSIMIAFTCTRTRSRALAGARGASGGARTVLHVPHKMTARTATDAGPHEQHQPVTQTEAPTQQQKGTQTTQRMASTAGTLQTPLCGAH